MTVQQPIQAAVAHHNAGRLAEAEAIYRDILATSPDDLNALNLLGVLTRQTARLSEAAALLQRAAGLYSANPDVLFNLGTVLSDQQRRADADAALRRAAALAPSRADIRNALAVNLNKDGKLQEAAAWYRSALALDPAHAAAHSNLGAVLMQMGQQGAALPVLRRAVQVQPSSVDALSNLGAALNAAMLYADAGNCFRRALVLAPSFAEAWNNLGSSLRQRDQADGAATATRRALHLQPNLGEARLNHCVAELPVLYGSEEEIERRRANYDRSLAELEAWIEATPQPQRMATAEALGSSQPFALPYQARNDVALQRRYGTAMTRLAADRYPHLTERPPVPPPLPDGRLRIGIASAHLREHSVWKAITRGWLQQHDRTAFVTHCYALTGQRDKETEWAEAHAHRFVGGHRTAAEWAEIIRRDDLHVLVYPEIGMDPMTLRLATLRLAPVQCVAWGHPETTGLPTIDHYLSGDRLEPGNGDRHYSEALERLPGLGCYYEPGPLPAHVARAEFGLPDGPVLFLGGQTLFKYLPQHDVLFVRLAKAVGDCRFVFFEHPTSADITRRFVARLTAAFAAAGLDWHDYGLVLPRLPFVRFQQLMMCVDVALDSLSFSGFNTAIEAMLCGLPVVTCRGPFMRSRLAAAIYDHIGVIDTVGTGLEGCVAIATRLALDPAWREGFRRRQAERLPIALRDLRPIRAMEELFRRRTDELMEPAVRHAAIIRLIQGGKPAEALKLAERALVQDGADSVVLHLAGLAARDAGDLKAALSWIGRACALAPRNADFQNSMAVVLRALGLKAEAEAAYRRALEIAPRNPSALGNLATHLGEGEEATALLRRLVQVQPMAATPWIRLGHALFKEKRFADAGAAFRNAVTVEPAHADALSNVAICLRSEDQVEAAARLYARSLRVEPSAPVMLNYASCLRAIPRMDAAAAVLDQLIAREPENGNAHFAKSMILLLEGRLEEGWREYAWRWKSPILVARPFPQPRWDGGSFAGKSLLVHTEQGMGDLLQLVRFMPQVKALGGTVYLELQPELTRLLDRYPGIDAIFERGHPPPPTDLQIPLMDLPGALGVTLENCTPEMPYMAPPPAPAAAWQARLAAAKGLKVGLVWAGNPDHANDRRRSMPPELLKPLLKTPGVSFYSLQVGGHAGKLTALEPKVQDLAPQLTDWTETAGALSALDLLITVDTSVCHMAGALGRPVWTMIPIECDWRWLLDREDTPWYPTMRLYRHGKRGDWSGLVRRMGRDLKALAKG